MNRDFFQRYYQTYNSESPEALAEFYHDDVTLVSAEGEQQGREALLDTYRYITERFRDRMTAERILIDGDVAAVEILDEFEAKCEVEDFLGSSFQQGDCFSLKLCAVYTVEQGKIRRAVIYRR